MLKTFVRTERQQRGWSQRDLAERAGIAQTYISGIERGQYTNPSYAVLRGLAQAFELPLDLFLERGQLGGGLPAPAAELAALLVECRRLGVPETIIQTVEERAQELPPLEYARLVQDVRRLVARYRALDPAAPERGAGAGAGGRVPGAGLRAPGEGAGPVRGPSPAPAPHRRRAGASADPGPRGARS
jgi:transcriptional regulator with XRE-family HTH domain